MSHIEFQTVDEDAHKLHWVEKGAMMIVDRDWFLKFSGEAHWNSDVTRSPVIQEQIVRYVRAENIHLKTGGMLKHEKKCVKVSCWLEERGPYQFHSKRRYFFFYVEDDAWKELYNFLTKDHTQYTLENKTGVLNVLKLSNPYVIAVK